MFELTTSNFVWIHECAGCGAIVGATVSKQQDEKQDDLAAAIKALGTNDLRIVEGPVVTQPCRCQEIAKAARDSQGRGDLSGFRSWLEAERDQSATKAKETGSYTQWDTVRCSTFKEVLAKMDALCSQPSPWNYDGQDEWSDDLEAAQAHKMVQVIWKGVPVTAEPRPAGFVTVPGYYFIKTKSWRSLPSLPKGKEQDRG